MSSRQEGILLIGALCLMSFIFQTQLKLLANQIAPLFAQGSQSAMQKIWLLLAQGGSGRIVLVLALAAAMFVAWLMALMRLDLSVALPLATIALVVNSIAGGLYVGETLSFLRMSGVLFVALGVTMVLMG
jgi:multidrug transporter EmrE-like cation transporter